jgi:hypothetical protein
LFEKEARLLDMSRKELAELRDQLDSKTIERNELKLKQEVIHHHNRRLAQTNG